MNYTTIIITGTSSVNTTFYPIVIFDAGRQGIRESLVGRALFHTFQPRFEPSRDDFSRIALTVSSSIKNIRPFTSLSRAYHEVLGGHCFEMRRPIFTFPHFTLVHLFSTCITNLWHQRTCLYPLQAGRRQVTQKLLKVAYPNRFGTHPCSTVISWPEN